MNCYKDAFFNPGNSSYNYYLEALFLKLKTLLKILNKPIKPILQKSDPEKKGICELIVLQFALVEICKLPENEAEVLCKIVETENG